MNSRGRKAVDRESIKSSAEGAALIQTEMPALSGLGFISSLIHGLTAATIEFRAFGAIQGRNHLASVGVLILSSSNSYPLCALFLCIAKYLTKQNSLS